MTETPEALDATGLYQSLRRARDRGGPLTAHEQGMLHLIRDVFEPLRVSGAVMRREAIHLPTDCPATLAVRSRLASARVVELSLRSLGVVCDEPLSVGDLVVLSIPGGGGRRRHALRGRVVRIHGEGSRATLALVPRGPVNTAPRNRAGHGAARRPALPWPLEWPVA